MPRIASGRLTRKNTAAGGWDDAAFDAGLRSYMLSVYNYMTSGVLLTGIVALLFLFGLTESRVLGFIGLSRLLVTYIQLTMAILPIFVLITTVRSVAGDREAANLMLFVDSGGAQ